MVKIVLLSVILMAIAFVLLGVKVLFVKGGRFPSGHVHDNPHLRRRGIGCAGSDKPVNRPTGKFKVSER